MAQVLEKKQEVTTRDFLNVVFRRKLIILAVVGFTTVAVVGLKVSQPQTYASNSRILVKRGERSSVFRGPTVLTWAEEVSSQLEIILSETVFNKAQAIFADSLAAHGISHFVFSPRSVRADVVGQSNVFVVGYSGYDPLECVLGCWAMTEAYKEYYRERAAPPAVADFFQSELTSAVSDLEHWREKKSEFLTTQRYVGVEEEADMQTFKLSRFEMDLVTLNGELATQRMVVSRLEMLLLLTPDELEDNLALGGRRNDLQTAIMRNLKENLNNLHMGRETLLQRYTGKHPEVFAIDKQILDLQLELRNEVENAYDVEASRLAEMSATQTGLQAQVDKARAAIDLIPEKEAELARIENKIKSAQSRYETLLKNQHNAQIALATTPDWEVTVLSPPSRAWPQKTKDYVRLALGPFLALIVGLGVAFFFESMDHSLKNAAEVEEFLGKSVLATFTEIESKK